jgi:hypothetical protein
MAKPDDDLESEVETFLNDSKPVREKVTADREKKSAGGGTQDITVAAYKLVIYNDYKDADNAKETTCDLFVMDEAGKEYALHAFPGKGKKLANQVLKKLAEDWETTGWKVTVKVKGKQIVALVV